MFDTIRVHGLWPLQTDLPVTRWGTLPSKPAVRVLIIRGGVLNGFECSLATLLFGHNGRLVENQAQLKGALNILQEVLTKVAAVPHFSEWKLSRADLAWNFDLPSRPFVFAHSALRVPGIRSDATLHRGGEGLSWRGANSKFLIRFYDKARKMQLQGSVLRVEISLSGDRLASAIPYQTWREFKTLWSCFYHIMSSVPSIQRVDQVNSWERAIAEEPPEIRARILARRAHAPRRTFRRWRQRIESCVQDVPNTFSWKEFLSPDGPPPAVHVIPKSGQHK